MSLTYFDFFSFFNNFSFIVSSVNKTFFACACKCLKTFFSSFIVSTQFSIFFISLFCSRRVDATLFFSISHAASLCLCLAAPLKFMFFRRLCRRTFPPRHCTFAALLFLFALAVKFSTCLCFC